MTEPEAARALKLARARAEREPLNPNRDLNVALAESRYVRAATEALRAAGKLNRGGTK